MAFLREYLQLFIFLVGLFGFFYIRKEPKTLWKTFPYFLMLVAILDWLGKFTFNNVTGKDLTPLYYLAIVVPVNFLYVLWLLNKHIIKGNAIFYIEIVVFSIATVYLTFSVLTTESGYHRLFGISYILVATILLLNILRYFYQLSQSDKIIYFYKERMFWVSLGLLLFWLGALPYFSSVAFLIGTSSQDIIVFLHKFVIIFNYLMYTCFIVSFLCPLKKT